MPDLVGQFRNAKCRGDETERRNVEENMGHRAIFGLLFVAFALVWRSTPQDNSRATSPGNISGSGEQLVGTWRLISRVDTLEDGSVVLDPGLGKTPIGYLMYDSS